MILAAIVIAFLLDQIRSAEPDHVFAAALQRWIGAVVRYADAGGWRHAWLAWVFAVAVPALVAGLTGWLCAQAAGWFGQLAWAVAVLYFTLGFRQFSGHCTAIRDALAAGDEARARELLTQWQDAQTGYPGPLLKDAAARGSIARQVIAQTVLSAHRCVFGVLFWFCLLAPLGFAPVGAVLYRYAEFVARHWQGRADKGELVVSPALLAAAQTAWRVIDWLPVRVTALVFATVGNFEDTVAAWRRHEADGAGDNNDTILLAAAAGALGIRLGDVDTAPNVKTEGSIASMNPVADQSIAASPVDPPECEPCVLPDGKTLVGTTDASDLFSADPDVRHFTQVAGLFWRSVALWLLLLTLFTLAHVLG